MRGVLLDPKTGRPQAPNIGDEYEIGDIFRRPNGMTVVDILRKRGAHQAARDLELAGIHPEIKALTRNKSYIGGRTAASGATARNVSCQLWNPHASARIQIFEIWYVVTAATAAAIAIARTTARGTASTSVTAVANHSIANDTAAPSGFTIDLAFSAQPTVSAANNAVWTIPATIGSGIILSFPDPFDLPNGTGLAVITSQAVALPVSDVTYGVGD
jgi:hypothetical protein